MCDSNYYRIAINVDGVEATRITVLAPSPEDAKKYVLANIDQLGVAGGTGFPAVDSVVKISVISTGKNGARPRP